MRLQKILQNPFFQAAVYSQVYGLLQLLSFGYTAADIMEQHAVALQLFTAPENFILLKFLVFIVHHFDDFYYQFQRIFRRLIQKAGGQPELIHIPWFFPCVDHEKLRRRNLHHSAFKQYSAVHDRLKGPGDVLQLPHGHIFRSRALMLRQDDVAVVDYETQIVLHPLIKHILQGCKLHLCFWPVIRSLQSVK